jgi:aerobic carbon-monoxide dehydrogenase medium subunit
VLRDPGRDVCRIVVGATDGKPYVVEDATTIVDDPGGIPELVKAAGLGHDPVHARLHAAAIRRALAELDRP